MGRFGIILLVAIFNMSFGQGVRVPKPDFSRFVGIIPCGAMGTVEGSAGTDCPGAAHGFSAHGLAGGEEIPDPAASELTVGGKVVVGFLEGKPFLWPRYSVEYPNSGWKWVVLNELSVSEQNRVFLTLWKHTGSSLDLVRIFPRILPLSLGETTVHAHASLPDGSHLVVLKGDGSESGIRLQDYRFLRLVAPDRMEEIFRKTNRSEIPVEKIMERLNLDQAVEAVLDSTLTCELTKRKAASGGPLVRFTLARNSVLYTKAGPLETPRGQSSEEIDIWKMAKSVRPGR
jgi:hypothetical protein